MLAAALLLGGCPGDDDPDPDGGGDAMSPEDASPDTAFDTGPRPPVPLSVVTWNVRNLFDERNDPDKIDEVPTASEVEEKLAAVGRVLVAADADVVLLQEVENESLLSRLVSGPLAGRGYTTFGLVDGFDPRGIDVGWIARISPDDVVSHLGERFPSADGSTEYFFSRDAVELFLSPGGAPVTVMVVHFRSLRDGGDDHRLAEALHVRRIFDQRRLTGVSRYVVAGDLNDLPGSPTLMALTEGDGLTDAALSLPASERWTTTHLGEPQQIDYVLTDAAMREALMEVRILRGPEAQATSDHAPVLARFVL